MTSFGCVPLASVCPWARCVDAITSRSSSALQTPTAHASWPIATWRNPGSSPARKRSSTFSSNRRMSSISRKNSRSRSSETAPFFSTFATGLQCTLGQMSLAADWDELQQGLPENWATANLRLTVPDEGVGERAAALLGPTNPGRRGSVIRFYAARRGEGHSPEIIRRLLERIDTDGIKGVLDVVGGDEAEAAQDVALPKLVDAWDTAVAGFPPDWSDLYAELELESSDWLERAALLMAPVNPARYGEAPGFRFRVASHFGYGASPAMTRRCLERVDAEELRGELTILRVLSDTHPVATQGPVWYVEGRSV